MPPSFLCCVNSEMKDLKALLKINPSEFQICVSLVLVDECIWDQFLKNFFLLGERDPCSRTFTAQKANLFHFNKQNFIIMSLKNNSKKSFVRSSLKNDSKGLFQILIILILFLCITRNLLEGQDGLIILSYGTRFMLLIISLIHLLYKIQSPHYALLN